MQYKKFMDKLTEGSYQHGMPSPHGRLSQGKREDDEYHNGPDPVKHTYSFKVSKDGAEPHHRSVTTPMTRKPKHELEGLARAHLEKQGYKIHESINEEHLVHVNDGSNYGDKPHPKDVEHVMAGAKKHNGEHDGNSDKGAFFKFKSHSDAQAFKKHVDSAPHKSVYADLNEGLDIIARSDYKLDKAGKKSHKEIVFHNGSVDQEKDDKLKREELNPSMGAGAYIKDFQKSDAPQFKGKTKEKKRMMGIAAYMAAKKGMQEETVAEAINDNLHPAGAALLKHIKPEHHNKYKAHLTTDTFNGSHKDRTDVLNAAKKAGHLKEDELDEANKESKKEFLARQERLAASATQTAKDPERLKRLMNIPGYSAAMDLAKKTTKEEVEVIDELSKSTLGSYAKKASRDAVITRKIGADFENKADKARSPGMKAASNELSQKYKSKSWKRRDGLDKAVDRLTKEETVTEAKDETPPFDGPYTKTPGTVKDKSGAVHTPMSRAKHLARQAMKQKMKEDIDLFFEAKDESEYGYEGDMAISQLKTIMRHSEHLMGMLDADTDLPEWVQSKITLATDYMQTAHDYMMSEMSEALKGNQHRIDKNKNGKVDSHDFKLLRKEETEQIDELSKDTLNSYVASAQQDNKDHADSRKSGDKDEAKYAKDRMVKRLTGIGAAKNRLNKEETIDEAMINGREYASHGLMHPTHAAHAVHKVTGNTVDFYAHGSGDKVSGKVIKNDGKAVHIKDNSGKTHKFQVTANLPKQQNEELALTEDSHLSMAKNAKSEEEFHSHMLNHHMEMMHAHKSLDDSYASESHADKAKKHADKLSKLGNDVSFNEEIIDEKISLVHGKPPRDSGRYTANDQRRTDTTSAGGTIHAGTLYTGKPSPTKKPDVVKPAAVKPQSVLNRVRTGMQKTNEEMVDEQAPVAPVPDRKYIKGTPENKALKASRKPINGMPTKVKEGANFDEEGNLMAEKKTYSQFVEQLLEYESDKDGVYRHTKGSYGKSYDSEDDDKPKKAEPSTVKRGRGRPAGAKSGANQKVSSGKSYGGIATHTLNLPK